MTEKITITVYAATSAGGVQTDITEDIISPITFRHGIGGISQLDRIADVGTMSFTVKNIDNKYPDTTIVRGARCGLIVTYDEVEVVRWAGKIESIIGKNKIGKLPTLDIKVTDYMDLLSGAKLTSQAMVTNKDLYDVICATIPSSLIPFKYDMIWNVDDGGTVFPTVFDGGKSNSTIYSEFNKLALSGLGYIYIRQGLLNPDDNWYKSTLRGEISDSRMNDEYTLSPILSTESGHIESERSELLLAENDDYIVLDERASTDIIEEITDAYVTYGSNVISRFVVKAYPRYVDSGSQVLFELDEPFQIAAGETKTGIQITYSNPHDTTVERVNGFDMVTPVSGLDYKLNSQADGLGTDLTANLTVTTVNADGNAADFGATGAIYKLVCVTTGGWVTVLQARGKGIYFQNPVERIIQNWSEVLPYYGLGEYTLDQKYIADITSGEGYATLLAGIEQYPRDRLESVTMIANTTPDLMRAFIYNDVGDLVHITLSDLGFSSAYYIQNVEAKIGLNRIVTFKWGLLEAVTFTTNFFTLDDAVLGLLDSANVLGY